MTSRKKTINPNLKKRLVYTIGNQLRLYRENEEDILLAQKGSDVLDIKDIQFHKGELYYAMDNIQGTLSGKNILDGRKFGSPSAFILHRGSLYFSAGCGNLGAISGSNIKRFREQISPLDFDAEDITSFCVHNKKIYGGSSQGGVYNFDNSKMKKMININYFIRKLVSARGKLYCLDEYNFTEIDSDWKIKPVSGYGLATLENLIAFEDELYLLHDNKVKKFRGEEIVDFGQPHYPEKRVNNIQIVDTKFVKECLEDKTFEVNYPLERNGLLKTGELMKLLLNNISEGIKSGKKKIPEIEVYQNILDWRKTFPLSAYADYHYDWGEFDKNFKLLKKRARDTIE